jgi:hypothetical protein
MSLRKWFATLLLLTFIVPATDGTVVNGIVTLVAHVIIKNPSAVKFYVDGKFVCDGKVADPKTFPHRYSCQWKSDTVPNGDYMVTVKVFAPAGES